MIRDVINSLIDYASFHLDLKGLDKIYALNLIIGELNLDYPSEGKVFSEEEIEKMEVPDYFIKEITDFLTKERGFAEKDAELKAILIMGLVTPSPENVVEKFERIKEISSADALDYLYKLGIRNYYFQKTMVDKNIVWKTNYPSKNIEVSINLSKVFFAKKTSDFLVHTAIQLEKIFVLFLSYLMEKFGIYNIRLTDITINTAFASLLNTQIWS